MAVSKDLSLIFNTPDYRESIDKGKNFYIQFPVYSQEVDTYLIKIVHRYLEKYDIIYLKDVILTVCKELITNGIKANIKRMFFRMKGLDISKKEDYRSGMEIFKREVYEEDSNIFEKLKAPKFIVRVFFECKQDRLSIKIINNTPILSEELKKIDARIKKGYQYNDISEAFIDVLDDSEGAGLGLILALMLMKNSGLPKESLNITTNGKITCAHLDIQRKIDQQEKDRLIADEILKEVDSIPSFPENILEIQKLCASSESTIKQIAESIKRDPGLTTAILKLANSAGYIVLNKVKTLEEAVKIIGLKGISSLLIASGVQSIMNSRYSKYKSVWDNSYRIAFYAQNITMQLKKTRLNQYVFLSALLCDIGQIVLFSIHPDKTKKIREIAGIKGIDDSNMLEEISLGISHSSLGSLICKKWKFNEIFLHVIEYHHRPYMVSEQYKELVYIVYLANVFVEIEEQKSRFETVEDDVLHYFNLTRKVDFETLHNVLKQTYETRQVS